MIKSSRLECAYCLVTMKSNKATIKVRDKEIVRSDKDPIRSDF